MVIIIKEFEQSLGKPVITFSADLSNSKFPDGSNYFVIGSDNEALAPDLLFSHFAVMFRNKWIFQEAKLKKKKTGKKRKSQNVHSIQFVETSNALEDGNKFAMGVFLLKKNGLDDKDLLRLKLSSYNELTKDSIARGVIVVQQEHEDIIKAHLIDMMIYARRSPFNSCTFFNRIAEFVGIQIGAKIHRDWDDSSQDLSLSRCPIEEKDERAFLVAEYKLSRPTPHFPNDCCGEYFFLEDHLSEIMDSRGKSNLYATQRSINVPDVCVNSQHVQELTNVRTQDVLELHKSLMSMSRKENKCSQLCSTKEIDVEKITLDKNIENNEQIIRGVKHKIKYFLNDNLEMEPSCKMIKIDSSTQTEMTFIRPWNDLSNFQSDILQKINTHQSIYVSNTWITSEMKVWLEYLFNKDQPQLSRYRCRFCHDHVSKGLIPTFHTSLLANKEGYFVKNRKQMRRVLSSHSESTVHKMVVKQITSKYSEDLDDCLKASKLVSSKKIDAVHEPTVRMFRTVYAEVRMNIPFENHAELVNLQKLNGAGIGVKHYERRSATRIMESISKQMHRSLIKFITKHKHPLSLILDTCTDAGNRNFLFLYFRTTEGYSPKAFFYRSLHVTKEDADSIYTLILNAFNEDNLEAILMTKLYGFASDGAPVFLGKKNGVAKKMNDHYGQNLYVTHCFSHKLEILVGIALNKVDGFKSHFEIFINGIYSFYNDKSYVRKASLIKTSETLGEQFYELNYIFPIRWVASEFKAVERIYKNYHSIVKNMISISSNSEFSAEIASKAKGFLKTLLNTFFYTNLLFLLDVLKILVATSVVFQTSEETIFNMDSRRIEFIHSLELLKSNNGPHLTLFLEQAECEIGIIWRKCEIFDLDRTNFRIKMNDEMIVFKKDDSRISWSSNFPWKILSKFRVLLIDACFLSCNHIFPRIH